MIEPKKPSLGLLGIILDLYEPMFPGITARQEAYAQRIVGRLSGAADIYFPGAAQNREDIEHHVRDFTARNVDGIVILMLTYGPSLNTYRALQEAQLPLLLLNTQPENTVGSSWDPADLTYNQGVHGAQDMANAIINSGKMCTFITGDWESEALFNFFRDWAYAARTAISMRHMRIAQIGQLAGMGDTFINNATMLRTLGPYIEQVPPGLIQAEFEAIENEEVNQVMESNRNHFQIDPKIAEENHRYAARLQVAIRHVLEKKGFDGYSFHLLTVAEDGRFRQLPMMAASNLMAEGYGYAAEGDTMCCTIVSAGQNLVGNAHFTEMYAMDFIRDAVLMAHMGEGNWRISRKDRPIQLIDRAIAIGSLDNPPTIIFSAKPGPATLTSLVSLPGEHFRMILGRGEILDEPPLPKAEMPNFFFKPSSGVHSFLNGWLKAGGSHHQCLLLGDQSRRWSILCSILNVELVEV